MTQTYVPPHEPAEKRGSSAPLLFTLGLIVLASLVSAGGYIAGRSIRPGEDARVRVPVAEVQAELPAAAPAPADPQTEAAEPAPPPTPFLAFDLARLHPQVAEAVLAARGVQDQAIEASMRAEAAAGRARVGGPGVAMIVYEGGDIYAGEVLDGERHGAGVLTWANPQEDSYSGEFADDAMEGLGIKRWKDGATYFGDRRREARDGHGVFVDSTGGGYEGAWANGAPNGYGVVWNPDGAVRSQGLWADNTLVEALIVPTPLPTGDPVASGEEAGSGDASAAAPEQTAPSDAITSGGASSGER